MSNIDSLNLQLTILRQSFDEAIIHGSSFAEVKRIYLQIKDLRARIPEKKAPSLNGVIIPISKVTRQNTDGTSIKGTS